MARRRSTVARHARLRSPSIAGQILTLLAVAVVVVLTATVGTVAYATYDLTSEIAEGSIDLGDDLVVPPDIGEIEGGVNLVVTGIDECEPEYKHLFPDRCDGPDAEGKLNDVNILMHISDAPRRVTVVSFPRDLVFRAPGCTRTSGGEWSGGTTQINALYDIGGLPCVVNAISDLSGEAIPFAATATFGGVIEITNAVGGVEVCVSGGIRDYHTGLNLADGNHVVQGAEALAFLRTRHGVGDESDLGRISNQQQYMSRLANKLISEEVLTDPATLYRLASSTVRSVTTNDRLANPMTLVQIALAVREVPFDQIAFVQYPTLGNPDDPNRVIPNYDAAEVLWEALAANQPIEITGGVATNGGTIEVEPDAGTEAPPETAAPEQPADPGATSSPDVVELPTSITGSTAAQQTCSAGNLRG
jgi:LCP family protein required for cell wall assembly